MLALFREVEARADTSRYEYSDTDVTSLPEAWNADPAATHRQGRALMAGPSARARANPHGDN